MAEPFENVAKEQHLDMSQRVVEGEGPKGASSEATYPSSADSAGIITQAPGQRASMDGGEVYVPTTGKDQRPPSSHNEPQGDPSMSDPVATQHERQEFSQNLPLRDTSSTYLGSVTSASEIFSPAVSGYTSSASLPSSHPSYDDFSVDGSSPVLTIPPPLARPMADAHKSIELTQDSNSSTSSHDTALPRNEAQPLLPSLPPGSLEPRPQTDSLSESRLRLSRAPMERSNPSTSPTRQAPHSPSLSLPNSADATPLDRSPDPYLSPALKRSADDEPEPSPSRTPLLQGHDYPPPRETHSLVKGTDRMGNRLINNYEVIRRLGTGAHGTVKLARNIDNDQRVAIKIVRRHPKKGRLGRHESVEDKVKKEIAVLKKARHVNVVSLIEVIDDSDAEKVYLILEFVELGEINWRKPTELDVARFELERVRREMGGTVDDTEEAEALAQINEKLSYSRSSSDLHEQEHLEREFESTIRPADAERLEHALRQHHGEVGASGTSSENLLMAAGSHESTALSSSINTVRAPSRSSTHDSYVPLEHSLGGSMHGSNLEDDAWTHASDIDHIPLFQDEPSEWTPEEEEYRYVPCLEIPEARAAFRDTVLGLEYLHFHGIIHRDIKPANLLWTANHHVKISDFGVSYLGKPIRDDDDDEPESDAFKQREAVELAKTVGTPAFYAPELCDADLFNAQRAASRPQITEKIDVWALGVTLYAMIYGRLPFYDAHEFVMYEKIAHAPVFISSKRLKPVEAMAEEGSHQTRANPNKRADNVIEYEEVDFVLKELLTRLLKKDPRERISLKEVKHHPWVLEGVADKEAWVQDTDPSHKSTAKPIEISADEVSEALAPRQNLVERVKGTIRRITSVVRGRDPRKRAESPKEAPASVSSSRSATGEREGRRQSLRGEDLISAVRTSREHYSDHPLAQSTLASPVPENGPAEFITPVSSFKPPASPDISAPPTIRPSAGVRAASAAESTMTVRGHHLPGTSHSDLGVPTTAAADDLHLATDSGGSSSSISKLLASTGRRINQRLRSREPGRGSRDSSNLSSRQSSADNLAGHAGPHHHTTSVSAPPPEAHPPGTGHAGTGHAGHTPAMVGFSPANVLGHLHSPLSANAPAAAASEPPPPLARQSSAESLQRPPSARDPNAPDQPRRRAQTTAVTAPTALLHERTVTPPPAQRAALGNHPGAPCPGPPSAPSDDQLTSGGASEASLAGRSGATSASSPPPVRARSPAPAPPPPAAVASALRAEGRASAEALMVTGETITPAILMGTTAGGAGLGLPGPEHDEAGYSADRDEDGDSDDEGIVMGGGAK